TVQAGEMVRVPSPDERKVLVVSNSELFVKSSTGEPFGVGLPINSLAEVAWAPDSASFEVTQSDGGWVGTWYATAYRISSGKTQAVNISREVTAEFQKRAGGCPEEIPNTAAVGW